MKKGILGLMTILMVCSCSEERENGTKAPTRVQTQIVSSASSDGSHTYVGIIEERQATGRVKACFLKCQFVNLSISDVKKLRD